MDAGQVQGIVNFIREALDGQVIAGVNTIPDDWNSFLILTASEDADGNKIAKTFKVTIERK
jgi:hypothetical protein